MLVIALAFVLALVGAYVSSLGNPANFGWFGYAPAPGIQVISGPDLTPWEQLLVWIGLIAAWAAGSVVLLRPSRERRDVPLTRAG